MGKGRYLLRRLIYIIFVFFIISILMFCIYKATPGDPVRMMIGDTGSMKPEQYEKMYDHYAEVLGVNKSYPEQYIRWITNMLRGDFAFLTYLANIILPELVYTILVTLVLYQIILYVNKKLEEEEQRSASKFV